MAPSYSPYHHHEPEPQNNSLVMNNNGNNKPNLKAQHELIVEQNKRNVRQKQLQYLKNEYERAMTQKQHKKHQESEQKQREKQQIEQKNFQYYDQLRKQREKRRYEKEHLSSDYNQTIDYHNQQSRYLRHLSNQEEDKTLTTTPTWVRGTMDQRQQQLKKQNFYNEALRGHLEEQENRKREQKRQERAVGEKIKKEADELLKREYEALQARHKHKSLFEKRQNELLGLSTLEPNVESSRLLSHEKRREHEAIEKQLYRQGLHAQFQKQQNEKSLSRKLLAMSQEGKNNSARYNPITNPIPYVYKNPNILRMFNGS